MLYVHFLLHQLVNLLVSDLETEQFRVPVSEGRRVPADLQFRGALGNNLEVARRRSGS
jgi:hypothetical protein